MENQALFTSKDKSKKFKYCLLQFLFGALRIKNPSLHFVKFHEKFHQIKVSILWHVHVYFFQGE